MAHIGNAPFGKTVRTVTSETITSVKTAYYPTGGYIVGYVDVYVNGVRLTEAADFTATDGTTVTLLYNPSIGDTVDVVTYGSIELANAVRRDGDTLVGTLYTRALVPTANVTYDIGTSTMRYKDLYLSGNTINLGDIRLSTNGTAFSVSNTTGGTFPSALANTTITGTLTANATTITGNVSVTGNATLTGTQFVNGAVTFANSTSNIVYVAANGNFGINTMTPYGGGTGASGPFFNLNGTAPELYISSANTTSGGLQGTFGAFTTGSGSVDKRGAIFVIENDGSNATTTNGRVKIWTNNGGTLYPRLWLSSNNNIGIGNVQSQPYSALHVFTSSAAPSWGEGITIEPSTSSYSAVLFRLSNTPAGNTNGLWAIGKNANTETGGECFHIVKNSLTGSGAHRSDAAVQFKTTGNTVFGFSVTKPKQPSYLVYSTGFSKAAGSWEKLTGFTEDYDTLDNWSTSTNKFTAPEAGKYLFYAGAWSPGNTNNGDRYAFSAVINGGAQNYITGGNYCSVDSPMSSYSVVLNLAQNDYVELFCFSAIATTIGGSGHKLFFGGYLLG